MGTTGNGNMVAPIGGAGGKPARKEPERKWLDSQHGVYKANLNLWQRNERRLRGGEDVIGELRKFDWELDGDHYRLRQEQAAYINFPESYATKIAGPYAGIASRMRRPPPSLCTTTRTAWETMVVSGIISGSVRSKWRWQPGTGG
jgi:hypothetical protein